MITIKDVADRAGVSITTVSHVINGTRSVSPSSQQRVQRAIKELNYVPSAVARSLKSARTHTIGLIVSNNCNPFFAEVVRGIEDTCYEADFNVILCNSDDSPAKRARYMRVLAEKQVDGLIVLGAGGEQGGADLQSLNVPHVEVDRDLGDSSSDTVRVDHEAGGRMAVDHLLGLGHRRIACLTGPLSLTPALQRLRGYWAGLHAAGVSVPDGLTRESDFTSAGGYAAMKELLKVAPRPTAVFAGNDLAAFGVICAAVEAGLRVPEDVSVVGYDDVTLAAYMNPPLTTVAQPMHQTGQIAAQMLINRIEHPGIPVQRRLLKPSLKRRRSTQAPADHP
jgi:LacI family transcriptional regulator